ncbi:hypothetical protein BC349_01500 [Flavihumibacter stibioxidans]|uniref:Secreted protein n=1 Tax=Flavihumibacter stibioxidans TaxID=1834163 RepID=A0ABR7M3M8_9BACT|nr:hypothetical protein [Flavihumibacter stibioxidans]
MLVLLVIVVCFYTQFSFGITLQTIPTWQERHVEHKATEYEEKRFHCCKYRNKGLQIEGCHMVAKVLPVVFKTTGKMTNN